MTEDNNYIDLEETTEPTAETAADQAYTETPSYTAEPAYTVDPLEHEQQVNRTRDFTEESPVLSPWAAAAAGVDPYARPKRFGQTQDSDAQTSQAADQASGFSAQGSGFSAQGYTYTAESSSRTQAERPVPGDEVYRRMDIDPKEPKKKKQPGYVTRRAFVIGMICCMLATSGLTVGGLSLAGAFGRTAANAGEGKVVSATNYTLADATGNEKSIEEIVAMNENAVVEIVTESVVTDSWLQSYVTQGAGSGVIIDSRGYIVTNNHVISGARSITVTLKTGEQFSARIVGADADNDVAVIKVEGSGFVAATYGNSDGLSVGDLAVAIGNPLGQLGGTVTTGIISALDRELTIDGKALTLLQTDASINPGNSGGGLFDGEGNLIGLVVAKSGGSNVEGLGFAIPINIVAPIVKDMIDNDSTEAKALIGINVINIETEEEASAYGFDSTGVFITEVNSPEAKRAGLEAGDMITGVGNVKIADYDTLTEALLNHSPGEKVTVTVMRNGEEVKVETTLIAG